MGGSRCYMEKEIQKPKKKKKIDIDSTMKTQLDIKGRMLINGIIIVVLFVGSIFMYFIASNVRVENRQAIISYGEKSSISYSVNIKPDNFYPTTVLGMNQQYPANAIDKIKVNYKYTFNTNEKGNYRYRYFATATVIANNRDAVNGENPLLLNRSFQLENPTAGVQNENDKYEVEKEYLIDYATYNNFVNKYKNNYGLTINATLKITFYVEVIDEYKDAVINRTRNMDVNIPLASNPIFITITNPQDISETIYDEDSSTVSSTILIVFATIMLIAGVLLLFQEVHKVVKSEKAQSKFISYINKIISANSEVIIKVKNKINLQGHNIIEVESIEQLLDAQNELHIPIAYFEVKRNREGHFVIVNGKEAWRYIYKVEEDK